MSPFFYEKEKKSDEGFSYYLKPGKEIEEKEFELLVLKVRDIINQSLQDNKEIVFLCIGSDRYIGDALGPIVGSLLKENQGPFHVYGTLEDPVHAFNLKAILKDINKQFKNPLIISVDASIGNKNEVGYTVFKEGSLNPGTALRKVLPKVGDYHFVGIINYIDPLPTSQFLNDTRLYVVMNIAKTIVKVVNKVMESDYNLLDK